MSAAIIDIADAVKAEIEAAELSQTPTVTRVYVPVYDVSTTSGLRVYVLGLAQVISDSSRSSDQFTYTVKLAIYRQADPSVTAELDAMVEFTQEVIDLFRTKRNLTGYAGTYLVGVSNDPVYDPAQLDGHRVFVSVVTLQYTLDRDL